MDAPHTNPLDYLLIQNAEAGNLEEVMSLIEKGANINALNNLQESLLMCTLKEKKIAVAIWLIENGADLTISNGIGLTVLDYIYFSDHPEVFQYVINHQGLDAQLIINNERDGHLFYHVVSSGLVNMVDFFIKNSQNWRTISDQHGREIIYSAINHIVRNKEKDGIYRLLSEMTREERLEMLSLQETRRFHLFMLNFEQALACCDKNVSNLITEGSHYLLLVNLLLPEELKAIIIGQYLELSLSDDQAIPVWYRHRIEKDLMDIEEENKPPVLFSQKSQPIKNKRPTDNDDVAKHAGCFSFAKPKPKFCSIQ